MRVSSKWVVVVIVLVAILAMPSEPLAATEKVDVLIGHAKPYKSLVAKIEGLGGTVRVQYKNIDAIAATIPIDQVDAAKGLPGVKAFRRDLITSLPEPRKLTRPEFGEVDSKYRIPARQSTGAAVPFVDNSPTGYFPYEAGLTRAFDFWGATGHFGEGVIVGIMDTGTADVPAISGRVLGGESFLSATPSLDDGLGPNSSANDAHGTWVATTLGANVIFGFDSTSTLVQSLNMHLPSAVLPDFFGAGIDGVPMVGQAPLAEFFALKIFNVSGSTSNSIILAAFDRTIELRNLYDAGSPGGVNIQVLNGSFSGASLNSANDPFFAGMVGELHAAGIVTCFSASNTGPSAMTIGDPALARNNLTVGATSIAAYEKVLRDLQYGLGIGSLYRANDTHQTAYFSSRGPTADGRYDPDITAPGFSIFAQGADGGLSVVSGTSFSSPMVAGAAALLLSAHPTATPDHIRGALLHGANPGVLEDDSGKNDQGFGFLDVLGAYNAIGSGNPSDISVGKRNVHQNVSKRGVTVVRKTNSSTSTGWLKPGETFDIAFDTSDKPLTGLAIYLDVDAALPPGQQNVFFTDDMILAVHSAKTSSIGQTGDYRIFSFVTEGQSAFMLGPQDLESGLTRITLVGDWTNAGNVKAKVTVMKDFDPPGQNLLPLQISRIGNGEAHLVGLDVPAGMSELDLFLGWKRDWGAWPTSDLDLLIFDPAFNLILIDGDGDGDIDGLSLDSPEKVRIPNPTPGMWTLIVDGFTVWEGRDIYYLFSNVN